MARTSVLRRVVRGMTAKTEFVSVKNALLVLVLALTARMATATEIVAKTMVVLVMTGRAVIMAKMMVEAAAQILVSALGLTV